MTTVQEVHSLEEFLRDPQGVTRRLSESGEAEVMAVGDKEVVMQGREAYRKMAEEAEFARHIIALKESIAAADRGELIPAMEVLDEIAREEGYGDDA